jgi:hypothetical protein
MEAQRFPHYLTMRAESRIDGRAYLVEDTKTLSTRISCQMLPTEPEWDSGGDEYSGV